MLSGSAEACGEVLAARALRAFVRLDCCSGPSTLTLCCNQPSQEINNDAAVSG
jgi:hypothetical protein